MTSAFELASSELESLDNFLTQINGGKIPNTEALDGFFAALSCCPDLVKPSEYMPVIQSGKTANDDLEFEDLDEAQRFMTLVTKHWNFVNSELNQNIAYMPLILEDEDGNFGGNDWANGFITGVNLRHDIWSEIINDEENGGSMVPIWALAYEHHPDARMRPFKDPIDDKKRDDLIVAAAAGVIRMHDYFMGHREEYLSDDQTFVRPHRKVGRNELCPCGSGKKDKKCCGAGPTIH